MRKISLTPLLSVMLCCSLSACDRNSMETMRKELKSSLGTFGSSKKSDGQVRAMPKAKAEPSDEEDAPMDMTSRGSEKSQSSGSSLRQKIREGLGEDEEESAKDVREEKGAGKEIPSGKPAKKSQDEFDPADEELGDEVPGAEEDSHSELEPAFEGDEDTQSVKKTGKQIAEDPSDEDSEAPSSKKSSEPKGPPAQDAIKTCPEKAKIEGKAPPEGLEQWCESKGGVRNGPYKKWHKNGTKRVEGNFLNGKSDGVFTSYSPDGEKLESRTYQDGKLNGLSTKWSKTGDKLFEVTYADGKREGPFVTYDRSGRKKTQGAYSNEKKDGVWIIFSRNGVPRSKVTWKDGKKWGRAELFFPTGERSSIVTYSENRLDGPFLAFYKDGKKKTEGSYSKGQKDGTWTQFRRNGAVGRVVEYDRGMRKDRDSGMRGDDSPDMDEQYRETKRRAIRGSSRRESRRERERREQDDLPGDPNGSPRGDEESWESM